MSYNIDVSIRMETGESDKRAFAMNRVDELIKQILEEVSEDYALAILQDLASKVHEVSLIQSCKTIKEFDEHVLDCAQCINGMMPLDTFWALSHSRPEIPCVTPGHTEDRFFKN